MRSVMKSPQMDFWKFWVEVSGRYSNLADVRKRVVAVGKLGPA